MSLIGIYSFGYTNLECFGGGSNKDVLLKTLSELTKETDKRTKLYLGLDWSIPNPFVLRAYYSNKNEFDTLGVRLDFVAVLSPFNGILSAGDLLLSCIIANTTIEFGNKEHQRTPGILLYNPIGTVITIRYIKFNTTILRTTSVTLNKTYDDVDLILDGPLQSGRSKLTNSKITIAIQQIYYTD
jgi:hypothetical protein